MTEKTNPGYNKILDELYEYLYKILKLYEGILPVIKDELAAITQEDIITLDENLKVQQALLYQTRDFDKKILDYTKKLNIEAENLSSLILQIPEDQQLRFYAILGHFTAAIQEVSIYKEKCQALLQTKIYSIDKILAEQKGIVENKTYERDASGVANTQKKSFETII
jgi:hypothetical protein